jgi:hypothetical protein
MQLIHKVFEKEEMEGIVIKKEFGISLTEQ